MREYIVPIHDDSQNHDEIFVGYIRENATEIVRCKDCRYYEENERWCYRLGLVGAFDKDNYCSHGERRPNG